MLTKYFISTLLLSTPFTEFDSADQMSEQIEWFSELDQVSHVPFSDHPSVPPPPLYYPIESVDINRLMRSIENDIVEKAISIKPSNRFDNEIAQAEPPPPTAPEPEEETEQIAANPAEQQKNILINFNNVSMIEYLRFISRVTNKNFIFDENDLQFNVTIVSEEPTSLENIMTTLLQELRIHDLILIEEGNNFIIHRNPKVNSISKVVSDDLTDNDLNINEAEIITKVFKLNTLSPEKAASIIRPLASDASIIEILKDNNQIIVTDLAANLIKISQLLKSLDSPNSGMVIGQYVVRLSSMEMLIPLAERIMQPIAQDTPLLFIPQPSTNSIFIVSTPYLVERTISIIQYLDQQQGQTRILELQELTIQNTAPPPQINAAKTPTGEWYPGAGGTWLFRPTEALPSTVIPEGDWRIDENGNPYFVPGGRGGLGNRPPGSWVLDSNGNWIYGSERLARGPSGAPMLPGGIKKELKFYTHKLLYRRGEEIQRALRRMAESLRIDEKGNEDLIQAIGSVQWLEPTNTLIVTGTTDSLRQVKELIEEIDIPLREVFLEMLILETTVNDSLNYGVTYGTRFGGGPSSGSQGFIEGLTPIANALNSTGVSGLGAAFNPPVLPLVPNGTNLANATGFNLGVIGQKITHCGRDFGSLGALVSTLHDRANTNLIINPKIIVEDNASAQIFIGINTAFKTQSVTNSVGAVLTNNFQFENVGTTLKVTPYLGNDDIVTLDIAEEVSAVISGLQTQALSTTQNVGPTTSRNTLTTRVHIPNGYFLIIGGLMQDQYNRERSQVPCLGGVPILGGLFTTKTNTDSKSNTMIFIRPIIIDSEEEIENLTKHQQDIWRYKRELKDSWDYETEEALDWFNLKQTLWHETECNFYNDFDVN